MKSLIILTLAFAVISCGRTNPQKKINEETKKAVDALKVKTNKEMSALKESEEKTLQAEKDNHKKNNELNEKRLTKEGQRIAMYQGAISTSNTNVKNLNKDLAAHAKAVAHAKALAKTHKESLDSQVKATTQAQALASEKQKALDAAALEIAELKKKLADASETSEPESTEEAVNEEIESLKAQLEDAKKIQNIYINSTNASPADLLGNPGDCYKLTMEEETQQWFKSDENVWIEALSDDNEMMIKFEDACAELQKVELVNDFQIEEQSPEETQEDIDTDRPVIISSQASTTSSSN